MSRTAIWASIAEELAAEIASGQRIAGEKLPSEAGLSARFGVNRHTVRRALADLSERGLVHARRGAGVFVQGQPVDYPLGRRTRLSTNLAALGREAGRVLLSLETRRASEAEAGALQIKAMAEVHVLEGISTSDGMPIALFRSVFPAARFPGLPETLRETSSVTTALMRHGVPDYTRAETRLSAEKAGAAMALHLRLREGDPILRTSSVNIDLAGTPVEFGMTWFAGDRVVLTVRPEDAAG
jgi:GntR family phosphonate transport system transcriptional regulator